MIPTVKRVPLWRRLLPFVLAALLLGYVLTRIDWQRFYRSLVEVNHLAFAGFMVAFMAALLSLDVMASVYVYRRTAAPVRFRELFVIRGASYLPSLVNHHVGQAWLTYFLSRVYDARLSKTTGATLVVYATQFGCLLALTVPALLVAGYSPAWLALPLGAGLLYLAVLALRPKLHPRLRFLQPLFDAGVTGHLVAAALRVPHVLVLFAGTWATFLFFGVDVPIGAALIYVPILIVAVTLPITPHGLGTRDALAVSFFHPFVAGGAGYEQRAAAVAAATTSTAVTILLIGALLGLALMRPAMKLLSRGAARSAGDESPAA